MFHVLLIALLLSNVLIGCATVPNCPICIHDGIETADCVWTLSGDDFPVDNIGHNYTQQGRNWSLAELEKNSLIMPPDSWAAIKAFILKVCRENPNSCKVDALQTRIHEMESKLVH